MAVITRVKEGGGGDYSRLKRRRSYGGGPDHWGLSMAWEEGGAAAMARRRVRRRQLSAYAGEGGRRGRGGPHGPKG
jgi:hypothetical protein